LELNQKVDDFELSSLRENEHFLVLQYLDNPQAWLDSKQIARSAGFHPVLGETAGAAGTDLNKGAWS
jgi:hypothetical protein